MHTSQNTVTHMQLHWEISSCMCYYSITLFYVIPDGALHQLYKVEHFELHIGIT